MIRFYIEPEELNYAIEMLDNHFIDNDLDEGNRIMIRQEDAEIAEKLLYDIGVNFHII